ncbi:MAG: protein of unassigned function [Sphingomonas bacterium]|uniref:hypothetical protein n=1 Tax=Sphingomonas bacterium TaxID=1895847 RepID=UPI0026134DFA|nr:hypothetical protein [Sphingomonas bacterium]MDB5709804.1 protein of unassigned function [Sphingomonas bacterium]
MSSLTKIVSLSREQLHAMVWHEPMTKVAARFGITDVALRKKCVRHSVPVPGRGFWQQRDAGRSPAPIALPRNAGTGSIEFCLQGDADAILSSHEAALSKGPLTSVAVRTRADHSAEAQQRMEAKAHQLEAVEREEREARTRAAEERKAVERLEADALAWERAQRLRAYIAAVASGPETEGPARDRAAWIDWATRQADAIDPLC